MEEEISGPKVDGEMFIRAGLEEALNSYVMDTFSDIETLKSFVCGLSGWMLQRETELLSLIDIKERAATIELNWSHVNKSQEKGKAFVEFMKSKFFPSMAEELRAELQEELGASLKVCLMGLEELQRFLEALERLCVTSVRVFDECGVLLLPEEGALDTVQDVIVAARNILPQVVEFKRAHTEFFSPSMHNLEVMAYQLDQYLQSVQRICGTMKKGPLNDFSYSQLVVEIDEEICDDDVQKMLDNITLLQELRQDEAFRMVFLFQEEYSSSFSDCFNESAPRMHQFLSELEDSAVQLDRMNMGARISSVTGSSVGAVGGVLSIIGLALIPVTAGASVALIMTGVGMGVTSGLNSAVTTAAEIGVNRTQQKRASEAFERFMEDVRNIQDCLDEVTTEYNPREDPADVAVVVGKILAKAGTVGKGIDSLVDLTSVTKVLRSEEAVAGSVKVLAAEGKSLRNVPRLASELPDVGQAAARGPLAMSRGARGGFIALNALFLGMDVFFIVKDSLSLSRGSETELSKFIRARSALWRSEMTSWQKIHELLEKGQPSFKKKQGILITEFYPELGIQKKKKITWESVTETGNKEDLCEAEEEPEEEPEESEKSSCILQ